MWSGKCLLAPLATLALATLTLASPDPTPDIDVGAGGQLLTVFNKYEESFKAGIRFRNLSPDSGANICLVRPNSA